MDEGNMAKKDNPIDGHISFAQRERHRRGRRAVSCRISGRWLRFDDPFDPRFLGGDAVYTDVMTDSYEEVWSRSAAHPETGIVDDSGR